MLTLGNRSQYTKRLQEALNNIPTFIWDEDTQPLAVDGHYGEKTALRVLDAKELLNNASSLSFTLNKIADDDFLKYLWSLFPEDSSSKYEKYDVQTSNGVVTVIDGREINKPPKNFYGVTRIPNSVMLHQTGCAMPQSSEFWANVNAHIGVRKDGTIILMHSWDKLIWHGHGLSSKSIGIEIEGNMRGVEEWDSTYWKPGGGPHSITDAQINALNNVLFDMLTRNLSSFQYVYAHRQSSDQREADPGSKIWKEVGLKWQKRLMIDRTWDKVTGTGQPIPKEWDPDSPYKYWCNNV